MRRGAQIRLGKEVDCAACMAGSNSNVANGEVEKQWHISARDWLDRLDEVHGI
jgi:hypothetical protein